MLPGAGPGGLDEGFLPEASGWPIVVVMNLGELPYHPAFLRLDTGERQTLLDAAEIWQAPAGTVLYYPGDSGEDLLLLLSGRLEYADRKSGEKRWFPGELWGEERLEAPEPIKRPLVVAEDGVWLRWSRSALAAALAAMPGLADHLAPLRDDEGYLLSGLVSLPRLPGGAVTGRSLRRSVRPLIPGLFLALAGSILVLFIGLSVESLPPFAALAPPALFAGWLLVFLFVRLFDEYTMDADSVSSRSFDWARFAVESRNVPMDRIQGVEVERNGLVRRILDYGSVVLKTSALEGELVLKDVTRPENLAREINQYRKTEDQREAGRGREYLRRSLEGRGLAEGAPRMLQPARFNPSGGTGDTGNLQFRKSLVVLAARLVLPVLVTLLPVLAADIISGMFAAAADVPPNLVRLAGLIPLFWSWYVFEDWRNDSFQVSGGYAIDLYRKPLGLKESRRQVDLASVQNIITEQKGFFSVLFRFGDVILVTAGGASDTVFKNVSRPWRVQQALFQAREEGLRRQQENRLNERREDFLRFAEALDQIRR